MEQGIPFLVGFPGYFAAALTIDRLGKRPLQIAGFAAMSALYLAASAALGLGPAGPLALAICSLSSRLRPQRRHLRSARRALLHALPGHGISAAAGKLGAALAAMYFPALMADMSPACCNPWPWPARPASRYPTSSWRGRRPSAWRP